MKQRLEIDMTHIPEAEIRVYKGKILTRKVNVANPKEIFISSLKCDSVLGTCKLQRLGLKIFELFNPLKITIKEK